MRKEVKCPNCGKVYLTALDRQHPEKNIQDEFPKEPAWKREQWLSGLCSDKCWNEYLGPAPDE
jgi:hypothetical protein